MEHREITTHAVNPVNSALKLEVMDGPGHGGASHEYLVSMRDGRAAWLLNFQNGPVAEVGPNGLTHEVLLAIVRDRLEAFQGGDYACEENEQALGHVVQAMDWLEARTRRRVDQGIEGTHAKDPEPTMLGGDAPDTPLVGGAYMQGEGAGGAVPIVEGKPFLTPEQQEEMRQQTEVSPEEIERRKAEIREKLEEEIAKAAERQAAAREDDADKGTVDQHQKPAEAPEEPARHHKGNRKSKT